MTVHSPILKKHFEKIGLSDDFFAVYETKTDDKLKNIDVLCDVLHDIKARGLKTVIYTDFDVDGIMSGIIAYAGLSELGFDVSLFAPTPAAGYGFHKADVDRIKAEYPDASVVLTGDVGTSNNETIEYARTKGLTVIVTDHHMGEAPGSAYITVNPNQAGETYAHKGICGGYVVYKVIEAYAERYCGPAKKADIYRLQVFAGIATVSDVMPLMYENRELVRTSVAIMRYFYGYELSDGTISPPEYSANYSRAFVGLKMLLRYFTDIRKIKTSDDINEEFCGFYLVPFLNSCKRMDGDMHKAYDIFFSERISPPDGFEMMSCVENGIKYVETLNNRRKEITFEEFERLMTEKASGQSPNVLYMDCEVYITNAGAGLCGLLANKFMNLSGLPTLVLMENEDGSFNGSARNPGWMDLLGALRDYDVPVMGAGHREAFGVYVPDRAALDAYVTFFKTVVISEFGKAIERQAGAADTDIVMTNLNGFGRDFFLDTELLDEFLKEKEHFRPFGQSFPAPNFKLIVDADSVQLSLFGRESVHAKFMTPDGIEVLLFNQALDAEILRYRAGNEKFFWVCRGKFAYDTYDNTDCDVICFRADSVDIATEGT